MKIVNICISAPYIEGFAYQENILTDYFLDAGLETSIIGSNIIPTNICSKKIKAGIYNDNGKKIIRINCFKISNDFVIPFKLYKQLNNEKPNVIFHHNLNCTSLLICTIYRIIHPEIILLVDNHVDLINCNKNILWNLFYYKTLVRFTAKFSSLFVKKFYGVTYSRCDFLYDVYGVNRSKIDFLPIGADVNIADSILDNKLEIRNRYNIPLEAFVFVSGGKMGKDKGTDNLIKAINTIQSYRSDIFLVLFGSFNDKETENLAKESKKVIYMGWCDHKISLSILKLADVAVWTIHHTTLIEDAISVNIPLLIRKTRTTEHLIDGNGIFLITSEYQEIYSKMINFINNNSYEEGCENMRERLNYKLIVKKIISDIL